MSSTVNRVVRCSRTRCKCTRRDLTWCTSNPYTGSHARSQSRKRGAAYRRIVIRYWPCYRHLRVCRWRRNLATTNNVRMIAEFREQKFCANERIASYRTQSAILGCSRACLGTCCGPRSPVPGMVMTGNLCYPELCAGEYEFHRDAQVF